MLWGGYLTAELGMRYHADSEDRYQQDDAYSIQNGRMSLFLAGQPGSQANRITTALPSQAIGWENGRRVSSRSPLVCAMRM